MGATVDGKDTTHVKGKAHRPAVRARGVSGVKLAHVWRGAAGRRWCEVCRWTEHKSERPGSIVPTALAINAELAQKGVAAHKLVHIVAERNEEMVKDAPVVACIGCGATGTQRANGFKRACGKASARGRLALARLARGLAPGVTNIIAVNLEQIG